MHRNRYVDFLRAAAILVVVCGHWLNGAPYIEAGELAIGNLLQLAPWVQGLTWVLQVMPVFFMVGGYANAASWESARRAGHGYEIWVNLRLKRLVRPMVVLLAFWVLLGIAARQLDVDAQSVAAGSKVAFIPTWFLAVYVMVVVVVPVTHWLHERLGFVAFFGFVLGAALVDTLAFGMDFPWLRWANYGFVWLSMHQLGYLWRAGRIQGTVRSLSLAGLALACLLFLLAVGPYPLSMISVPGEAISNSAQPTLALLALGVVQGGITLALEPAMRLWLGRPRPWAFTVLINGLIMTLFLWHTTVMVLMVGVLMLLGGFGLGLVPDTPAWWATRPIWMLLLAGVLLLFVAIFGRFERGGRTAPGESLPAWRAVVGSGCICGGLAVFALKGIGAEGVLGVKAWMALLTFLGAAFVLAPSFGDRRKISPP